MKNETEILAKISELEQLLKETGNVTMVIMDFTKDYVTGEITPHTEVQLSFEDAFEDYDCKSIDHGVFGESLVKLSKQATETIHLHQYPIKDVK